MPDRQKKTPTRIVGVGGSAGGLAALGRFFEGVPPDSGVALVAILHLDPDRESQLADILDRNASIPVTEVTESVEIEPDHAYVISPHSQLEISGTRLTVEEMPLERPRMPIDRFFRSLAEERGSGVGGVVLSGTGRDGARGLRAIREKGGVTGAQEPGDAEYAEMPRSAIAEGRAEIVLPADRLAPEILRVLGEDGLEEAEPENLARDTRTALERIIERVGSEAGHDLSHYKRSTFMRRLDRRMRFRQVDSVEEYARELEHDREEREALFQDLLISVSHFFRDPEAYEVLERKVVPEILEGKGAEDQVRAWVPGCATGEEAYSVAILLHEHAGRLESAPEIQVFATDIDERALSFARRAHYPESVSEDIPKERLARSFDQEPSGYRVIKSVRDSVLFAVHGILTDPPFSNLDLVSCRNLLIYLESPAQKEAVERIHYGLRSGGFLFLGSSETVGTDLFDPVAKKERIYRRVDTRATIPVSRPMSGAGRRVKAGGELASEPDRQTGDSPEELHGRLLRKHSAPSVVVDADHEIIHLSEGVGRYLRHPGGLPTKALLDVVREPFVPALRAALYRGFTQDEVSKRTVEVELEGAVRLVDVVVHPVVEDRSRCALVLFEERTKAEELASADDRPDGYSFHELRKELRETREQLQTTIEEREATIEELQSANEELQSVNEEHQATAEELETRREELQSVNEELTTINQEHRATIDELTEVNADLRNLMESTEIATLFLDEDVRVRRFTESATDLFNLLPSDRGRPFDHISHNLDLEDELVDEIREVLETRRTVEREVWDEQGRCYVMGIHPYVHPEDRLGGVVVTCFEITDRKKMEEDVRQARSEAEAERRRLLALMDHLPAGIVLLDAESRAIVSANQRARRILGEPEVADLVRGPGADEELHRLPDFGRWPVERAIETGEAVLEQVLSVDLKDRRRRDLLVSAAPIGGADGDVDECVLVLVDVEEVLRHTREKEAERTRERLMATVSTVSHEFRTPLNSILGYTQLLTDGVPEPIPDRQVHNVERIQACVRHLNFMVEQMLVFTRIQEEDSIELQEVDPEAAAREATAILEPQAREKDLPLGVEPEKDIGEIVTDPDKLRQVLVNLIQNGIKFTEEGEVAVAVLKGEDGGVVFEVRDTGIGIEPEQQERIFDRFWKPQGQPKGVQSTGLGLAIVKELTDRLGGRIEVESAPGRGSVFRVGLPPVPTEGGDEEPDQDPSRGREPAQNAGAD